MDTFFREIWYRGYGMRLYWTEETDRKDVAIAIRAVRKALREYAKRTDFSSN